MEDRRTDKHLLLACRGGDEAAWEALVNRYQRLIYAIPRRAGLDEDQSAEVFQEVFTTLFQRMNDIEEPERLHAWLVTTARRKTFRVLHKDRTWQKVGVDNEKSANDLVAIPDDAALADEVLVELEEQHQIRVALASLDDRCRKLLTMLFYEDEPPSYGEIAKMWGTSEGSIGPTRARCLQKMLRLLER
jgi:RNA polymerase sigma factor (sigma-70 family)